MCERRVDLAARRLRDVELGDCEPELLEVADVLFDEVRILELLRSSRDVRCDATAETVAEKRAERAEAARAEEEPQRSGRNSFAPLTNSPGRGPPAIA